MIKNLAYVAKNVLTRLYEAYVANKGDCSGQDPKSQSNEGSSSGLEASKDTRALRMSEFKKTFASGRFNGKQIGIGKIPSREL